MTRLPPKAPGAGLAATPWPPQPDVTTRHPQAAWYPNEVCTCDECVEGREEARQRRSRRRTPHPKPERGGRR